MKNIKRTVFLATILLSFIYSGYAQEKEIIIIEKTLDVNGNEVSKKIIRKSGESISDTELEELLEQNNSPFGSWDIKSFDFGSPFDNYKGWLEGRNNDSKPTIGLSLSFENNRVKVVSVSPRSGAAESDIRPHDELVSIEGSPISSYDDIALILNDKKAGDKVRLKIYRDGQEYDKSVTLKSNNLGDLPFGMPETMGPGAFFFDLDGDGIDFGMDSLFNLFKGGGMDSIINQFRGNNFRSPFFDNQATEFNDHPLLKESIKPSLGVYIEDSAEGVEVTDVIENSAADKAGLKKGDIIKRFDDQIITSFRELSMLMNQVNKGDKIVLEIDRANKKQKITVNLD